MVRAESDADGNYQQCRDVLLESAINPLTGTWATDMMYCSLPTDRVVDLIKWADSIDLHTVYEPAGNMAGYFRPTGRRDQPSLFDIGDTR